VEGVGCEGGEEGEVLGEGVSWCDLCCGGEVTYEDADCCDYGSSFERHFEWNFLVVLLRSGVANMILGLAMLWLWLRCVKRQLR
jgi:hypothetical protein